MIKLDKNRIRYIALNRFFDKYHESVYDCWTDALEVWLEEQGYEIVKKRPDSDREAKSTAEPKK